MSDAEIYPYVIEPQETTAIWGGDALVLQYGKAGDVSEKLGESWECWDENRILNGPLAGTTIAGARQRLGAAFLGDLDPNRIFPILTKIIDARDWLSVQVHPDDAYAQRVEGQPNGKTECWFIFSAEPGSELVLGWTRDTSREEYERRVADGTLGEILRRVPVKAGEAYYLPSGTLHAIGKGIVLFETQQASDLTYRIFDWNRLGADGKPRELAVSKAADVLDYRAGTGTAIAQIAYDFEGLRRTALIADRRFVVERIVATREPAFVNGAGRPSIVMAWGAPLEVCAGGATVALAPYQTSLIPAAAPGYTVRAASGDSAEFAFVTPPADRALLPARMLASGVAPERVDAFMRLFD